MRVQLGQGEAAVELTRSQVCVTSYFVPSGTTQARTEAVATQQRARQEQVGERRREKRRKCAHAITSEGSTRYHSRHRGGPYREFFRHFRRIVAVHKIVLI